MSYKLLSFSNPKIQKSNKVYSNYLSAILHMSPINTKMCPYQDIAGCKEACLNTASERIECIHPAIEIVSMNDHYGYGTIDMVWRCKDCGIEMAGQIDMQELWHYDMTAKEIQQGFEVKA